MHPSDILMPWLCMSSALLEGFLGVLPSQRATISDREGSFDKSAPCCGEYFEVCFGGGLSCLGVGSVGSEAWPVAFKHLVFRKGL